ncbi:MAG: PIN domain-containing protein [Candidatus Pacebacteria bacterium]|nr:PIN domain-containing protein [Candidatus Paceibacterota bacterium]
MELSKIAKFKKDLLGFKKIGLDSMCFIYQFAEHPDYSQLTTAIFELLETNKILAVTSTISIIEVFVRPEALQDQSTIIEYERVFQELPNLEIISINWHIARLASKLRAKYKGIRIPDALQIAAPLLREYPAFITNDIRLKKVKEIKTIILKDYL